VDTILDTSTVVVFPEIISHQVGLHISGIHFKIPNQFAKKINQNVLYCHSYYEKKVLIVMIKTSTIINKLNINLSPQLINIIKDHDIRCWNFRFWEIHKNMVPHHSPLLYNWISQHI
jgi:hypothetical protein